MPRNPFQRPPVVNRKNAHQPHTGHGGDPWQKPKRVKKRPVEEPGSKDATPVTPDKNPTEKP